MLTNPEGYQSYSQPALLLGIPKRSPKLFLAVLYTYIDKAYTLLLFYIFWNPQTRVKNAMRNRISHQSVCGFKRLIRVYWGQQTARYEMSCGW